MTMRQSEKTQRTRRCGFCRGSGEQLKFSGGGCLGGLPQSQIVATHVFCNPCGGSGQVPEHKWKKAEINARRYVYLEKMKGACEEILSEIGALERLRSEGAPRSVLVPFENRINKLRRTIAKNNINSLSFGDFAKELEELLIKE